jgi:hypothetical protein
MYVCIITMPYHPSCGTEQKSYQGLAFNSKSDRFALLHIMRLAYEQPVLELKIQPGFCLTS